MLFTVWSRLSYFLKDFLPYIVLLVLSFILLIFAVYKIFFSHFGEKKKKTLIFFTVLAFSTVLVISLFEFYFRYIYDQSDGLGFLRVNEKWHERHVTYVFHNAVQFRDEDFDTKLQNKEAEKIAVIGDSLAFGAGIKDPKNRFSDLLAKKLKSKGRNVEVFNLAKPGYDTEGEIEVYKKAEDINFDIVVWQYFLNDIQPKGKSTGSPILEEAFRKKETLAILSKNSFFFDYLYWRFTAGHQKTLRNLNNADFTLYRDAERFEKHQKEMLDFIRYLKAKNKKVVVVIFPSLNLLGPDYPSHEIHKDLNNFFRATNVEVIDLLEDLKDKNRQHLMAGKFDSHPNEYVHELAAIKLAEVLLKQAE